MTVSRTTLDEHHAGDACTAVLNARPRITEVETHGIDTIPHQDRTSTRVDLLRIPFGGANTFATVLLGTFPIVLGLSFWQAVRGRVIGSFLSLLTAVAFYSISVWVSGDALVGGLNRLAGVEDSVGLRTIVYAIIGLLVIIVVVYGFQFMLLVNKTAVITNTAIIVTTTPWMVIMAIGFIVRRGHFSPRDLQVFNKGGIGGAYWFNAGVNWRGITAWIGGGMDLSLVTAVASAAVLYQGALWFFPEPRSVFGEDGPRLVSTSDAPLQKIVTDHSAIAAKVHARAAARVHS